MARFIDSGIRRVENDRRVQVFLLLGTIALAAGLRFYKLGEWSLWIDEWFSIDRAMNISTDQSIVTRPVYLILMRAALSGYGINALVARLTPALTGVLSIPLLYWPTRRIFGTRVALLTGLLLAVSPWHVFWSQNARFYVLLLLFSTLGYLFLFEGLEKRSGFFLAVGLVFILFALREKLSAAIMLPFPLLYLFVMADRAQTRDRRSMLWLLGLIVLPLFIFLAFDLGSYLTAGRSKILEIIHLFAGSRNTSPARLAASISYRIGLPNIVLGVFGGAHLILSRDRQRGVYFALGALVPVSLLILLSLYFFTVDRYVFVSLPFWLILTAVALVKMYDLIGEQGRVLACAVFVLVVGIALSEDFLYFTSQQGNRPNWERAFEIVEDNGSTDDLVLTTRPELGEFYLGKDVEAINSYEVEGLAALGRPTWFVIDESTSYVRKPVEAWIVANSELIDIVRVTLPSKRLDIRIYLYRPGHGAVDFQTNPVVRAHLGVKDKTWGHVSFATILAGMAGARFARNPSGRLSPATVRSDGQVPVSFGAGHTCVS